MRKYSKHCEKCNEYHPCRKSNSVKNGIREMADVMWCNGVKIRNVWARIEVSTDKILNFNPIS